MHRLDSTQTSLCICEPNESVKLLLLEYQEHLNNPIPFAAALPTKENLFIWVFCILGPFDSMYSGMHLFGQMFFTGNYPYEPPQIRIFTLLSEQDKETFSQPIDPKNWNRNMGIADILRALVLSTYCQDRSNYFEKQTLANVSRNNKVIYYTMELLWKTKQNDYLMLEYHPLDVLRDLYWLMRKHLEFIVDQCYYACFLTEENLRGQTMNCMLENLYRIYTIKKDYKLDHLNEHDVAVGYSKFYKILMDTNLLIKENIKASLVTASTYNVAIEQRVNNIGNALQILKGQYSNLSISTQKITLEKILFTHQQGWKRRMLREMYYCLPIMIDTGAVIDLSLLGQTGSLKNQSSRNKVENFYPDGFCGVESDKLEAELHNAYSEESEALAHITIINFMFLESQVQLDVSDLSLNINLITTILATKTPLSQWQPQIDGWRMYLQEYYDPIVNRLIKLDEINKKYHGYSKNRENQICSPSTSDFINSEMKLIQEYKELLEKWIDEQKAREKESPSEPNCQSRTYLEELLVEYDYFSSLANHISSYLKYMELTVFYYSTKKIPKETCDFIKKYWRYEAKGADGTVFKFGGLNTFGVAIKILSNPVTISFYQDKGVKLRHDHIVRYVYCFPLDITGPTSYALLMEKLTNALDDYIYSDKYISRYLYIDWLTQIVCGMEYLHENRIIHKDLKPENILLYDGKIKICDLDRACCFDDVDKLKSSAGTIRYMAPETLARGNKLNEKVDIWSFGVVLWEMLVREQPYKEFRKAESIIVPLLRKNLSLRPLPEMVPNVLKNLIKECLNRDPDRRPSFREIVDTIPKIREAIIHIKEKSWHNISQQQININNIDHWAATEAAFSVLRDHSK